MSTKRHYSVGPTELKSNLNMNFVVVLLFNFELYEYLMHLNASNAWIARIINSNIKIRFNWIDLRGYYSEDLTNKIRKSSNSLENSKDKKESLYFRLWSMSHEMNCKKMRKFLPISVYQSLVHVMNVYFIQLAYENG